jgi:ABC-type phosphate/phosphonate transport system permease subunit
MVEVLFFPWKEGMFDCFNHVVKIDARVVPIELHFSYEAWQHHDAWHLDVQLIKIILCGNTLSYINDALANEIQSPMPK